MAESKNYYKELGIAREATSEEVISAVKQLVKINNPESFTDSSDRVKAQEKLKTIKIAYETLKDSTKRFEYDLLLDEQENVSSSRKSTSPNKKKSNFKLFTGLFLGTVAVTAGGTAYLMKLDCGNIRNTVDLTVCEKTKTIREIFGSTDVAPPVVVTAESANQTPSEKPVDTAPAVTNEPTSVSKESDVKNTEPVNVQVNVTADNSINTTIPIAQTAPVQETVSTSSPIDSVTEVPSSTPIASQTQIEPAVTLQPAQPVAQQPTNTGLAPSLQTVIVEGVGTIPQDAAQNAAQNALTNVVGTFIDANTMLQKRILIDDGIKSETKNISKDIKEYSQGSIKSFEIIDTKNEGGLFRLTAKVTVRNENFSAYIKKIAEGEAKVGGGLFAQMATEIKQKDNLVDILKNNVITPILSGEAQDFVVESPMLLSQAIKDNKLPRWVVESIYSNDKANPKLVIFEVKTLLKKEFSDNLISTLKSSSSSNKCNPSRNTSNSWCLGIQENKNSTVTTFFSFSDVIDSLYEYIYKDATGWCANYHPAHCLFTNLKVNIIDNHGNVLIQKIKDAKAQLSGDLVNYASTNSLGILSGRFSNEHLTGDPRPHQDSIPWLLIEDVNLGRASKYREYYPNLIIKEKSFYVVLSIEPDVMKNADKILVTLEK